MKTVKLTLSALALLLFSATEAFALTVAEKMLRESPRLSWNMGLTYDANLQSEETYEAQRGLLGRLSPRYRLSDAYTLIGSVGISQRLTQENRSEMTNTTLSVSRNPIRLGIGDLRMTGSLILPTNLRQRKNESFRAAARLGANYFIRTNTPLILEAGASATLNNHRYNISAYDQANIQRRATPYITVGWGLGDHWQVTAYNAYDATWTYRDTYRGFFTLDQSITYIPNRKMSFTVGHNNAGSVVTLDGRDSNVAFFNTRTSTVYFNGTFNY